MAYIHGNSIKISIGEVIIGGQQGCSLNRGTGTTDSTTKDSGYWEEAEASELNWSIDCDGLVVVSDEGLKALREAWASLSTVKVKYGDSEAWEEGNAIIESLSENAPQKEKCTYSVTLKGVGELVQKTASEVSQKAKK